MKKTAFIFSIIAALVMFAGCKSSRTPITAEEFITKAEAAGYTVQDSMDQLAQEVVEGYLIAYKEDDDADVKFQIEFVTVSTVEQAKAAYTENYNTFKAKKGSSYSESSVKLGNYAHYKLTSGGRYYVISRTETTFVYIDADSEYKGEIVEFLKDIGY